MTQFLLSLILGIPVATLVAHLVLDDDSGRTTPAADLTGSWLMLSIAAGGVLVTLAAVVLWRM